jgi:hypothetical protein
MKCFATAMQAKVESEEKKLENDSTVSLQHDPLKKALRIIHGDGEKAVQL